MTKINGWKVAAAGCLFATATAIAASAQTFTTLASFDGTNGANPQYVSLVQGTDGNLYGTTMEYDSGGDGNIFKVTPEGTLTALYRFCAEAGCPDGSKPEAGLVLGSDGNFYGTTSVGGNPSCGCGTVFKVTPSGTLTTLHSFDGTDGAYPYTGLVQGADGNFYGTTSGYLCGTSCGTIFKITQGGALTTLHNFSSPDGAYPFGTLVQATDGIFYGTTWEGGTYCLHYGGCGTVFNIAPRGTLTTLHNFNNVSGAFPIGALVQGTDGNFYGTTTSAFGSGGTVFKITPGGIFTPLDIFCLQQGCPSNPQAGLVQATDGNFYGATQGVACTAEA